MKFCNQCGTQMNDGEQACPNCGTPWVAFQKNTSENTPPQPDYANSTSENTPPQPDYTNNTYSQPPYSQPYDCYDHTAEFSPQDIADNKLFALLAYLLGVLGIIIALLACKESRFVSFHTRQAIKLVICETLLSIAATLLAFTVIVPIAASIMLVIISVIRIISFFDVCKGKAKEPAIIRSFDFLR